MTASGPLREVRGQLSIRWRRALGLVAAGAIVGFVGAAILVHLTVVAEPAAAGGALLGAGIFLVALGEYVFATVRKDEASLRGSGAGSKVNRSFLGNATRVMTSPFAWEECIDRVVYVLNERRFGLVDVERTRGVVQGFVPADGSGPFHLSRTSYALRVRVRVTERGAERQLLLSVVPDTLATTGVVGWIWARPWVADAESVADTIGSAIASQVAPYDPGSGPPAPRQA
jgi:hypothetical protein